MFKGFTEKTSQFMWDLAFNNERPWFLEHKQEFEDYLNTPFKALAEETCSLLSQRYPDTSFYLHVSRIYRDARRLHGRGPYKEKMWFTIKTTAKDYEGPVFWFELAPAEYSYGMGIWSCSAFMELFRSRIDANPAVFEKIALELEKYPELQPEVEEYKKPKGSYGPPISRWYNRKRPGVMCAKEFGGALLKPDFPATLTEEYGKMMPMFDFLMDVYNRLQGSRDSACLAEKI